MDNFEEIKKDLIKEANNYTDAFNKRNERFVAWNAEGKANFVKETLNEIKDILMKSSPFFEKNLYVDETNATMSSEKGDEILYSKPIRTIVLRSGIIMVAGFTSQSEKTMKSMVEKGFQILFNPMLNGKIHVIAVGHTTEGEKPEGKSIAVIEHPNDLTTQLIWQLVLDALKSIKSTSYLFI